MIGTHQVTHVLSRVATISAITNGDTFSVDVENLGRAHICGPRIQVIRNQKVLYGIIWFDDGGSKIFECLGRFSGDLFENIEVRVVDDGSNI